MKLPNPWGHSDRNLNKNSPAADVPADRCFWGYFGLRRRVGTANRLRMPLTRQCTATSGPLDTPASRHRILVSGSAELAVLPCALPIHRSLPLTLQQEVAADRSEVKAIELRCRLLACLLACLSACLLARSRAFSHARLFA